MLAPLRCLSLQPKGFFRRTRGRIYVAFGEHPAAGVCVCVCSSKLLCVCVFVRLFVSLCPSCFLWLVGCLWSYGFSSLFGSLGHLLVCLFAIWVSFLCVCFAFVGTLSSNVAPGAPFRVPWITCCCFFALSGPLGLNFVTPGLHLDTLWSHFGVFLGPDLGPEITCFVT